MADVAMRTLGPASWISRLSALFVVLVLASEAWANPCGPHPTKLAAWIIVVGASLLLEVFVTAGFLCFSGIAVAPMFFALVLGSAVSYLGILLPLYETTKLVWLVEIVILGVETFLIKGLSYIGLFQGDPQMAVCFSECPGRQRVLLLRRHAAGLSGHLSSRAIPVG